MQHFSVWVLKHLQTMQQVSIYIFLLLVALRVWRKQVSVAFITKTLIALLLVRLVFLIIYMLSVWGAFRNSSFAPAVLPPHSVALFAQAARGVVSQVAGAVITALTFISLWYVYLKRGKGVVLDLLDVALITLSCYIVGWPLALCLLAMIMVLAVIWMLCLVIARKKKMTDRLIVTQVILPAAALTYIFGAWLLALTHLDRIRF